MIQDNPSGETEGSQISKHDIRQNIYIIALSLVVAGAVIGGSVIYGFNKLTTQLASSSLTMGTGAATGSGTQTGQQAAAPTPTPAGPVTITLKPNTPFLGNKDAKVTVVEYADYECPFCEQLFKTVIPDIKAKYIDTGKIKFVYQDFAFLGPDSNTAAEASHCAADQDKFWQYHDYLFSHQGPEGSGWATAAHQKEFAQAVGLNMTQFNQCLDGGKYKQEVLDETTAGKNYGVTGTPSIFVNGQIIVGAQPAATFEQAIETALNK